MEFAGSYNSKTPKSTKVICPEYQQMPIASKRSVEAPFKFSIVVSETFMLHSVA